MVLLPVMEKGDRGLTIYEGRSRYGCLWWENAIAVLLFVVGKCDR